MNYSEVIGHLLNFVLLLSVFQNKPVSVPMTFGLGLAILVSAGARVMALHKMVP